jgi:hypothetical protein
MSSHKVLHNARISSIVCVCEARIVNRLTFIVTKAETGIGKRDTTDETID